MRRAQAGVALIEALIGMLIFAFGVLGLVGLQASVTQAQTSGKFRADASNLVDDLFGLVQTDHVSNFAKYSDGNCAGYARCADWRQKVLSTLPDAKIAFVSNAGTGSMAVTLSWQQGQQSRNNFSSSMAWQQ
ncbi:PilV family protein [Roseateles oligotrophus]|uniref:hypothetical protein n=1 Tax=Roseateles oligotrophus TaxID=1769250 RepID=UPI0021E4D0E3|nr:hypothetical protein [Roseateles oligotrophus]